MTNAMAPFVALSALLASCSEPATPRVADLAGAFHTPLAAATDAVQVFVVTSHECPIANAYAPVLGDLAEQWAGQPVELWIVQADPDLGAAAAKQHANDYALPGTVVLDPHHELILALGATKTPEAIVRRRGAVLYRGRIDDQWAGLGARRQEASQHDLKDAVAAALRGGAPANARTEVIGCLLPEPRRE